MNIERWIGSVINLSSVPCFGVCGKISLCPIILPFARVFFTDCSTIGSRALSFSGPLLSVSVNVLSVVVSATLRSNISETKGARG